MVNESLHTTALYARKHASNSWWKVLLLGALFYFLGIAILFLTHNPNLFPTVVILGNFMVPATYVAFFYERRHWSRLDMPTTAKGLLYGGVLGVFAASLLEPLLVIGNSPIGMFEVALIEELVKILGVLLILRRQRHDAELDGLILGAAAGMGFAALESTGYAFSAFLQSGGNPSAAFVITLMRGIMSPLGHGTWTAILAAVIFRESDGAAYHFNRRVWGAYLVVVLLHALWDLVPGLLGALFQSNWAVLGSIVVIGAAGLLILWWRWREAKRRQLKAMEMEQEAV